MDVIERDSGITGTARWTGAMLEKAMAGRSFRFERIDGAQIGALTLQPDGSVAGYQNANEASWAVDGDALVLRNAAGLATTRFATIEGEPGAYVLTGTYGLAGALPWHVLREIPPPARAGAIPELLATLYGGDGPLDHADPARADRGYPHTNLQDDVATSVLEVVRPRFWLELGSMLGGSAIRVARLAKALGMATDLVCIDPFTGDVNMWAWEQQLRSQGRWRFLALEQGRPTIYDRFLANVAAAGHAQTILPIQATSIVGLKLLRRLHTDRRLSALPEVIYLDSAHEPGETLLELQACWALLPPGGVLMGDDWAWQAVREDVLRFARTITPDPAGTARLIARHPAFVPQDGILLDRGQWVLAK